MSIKIAMVFPGQGSQSIGMLEDIAKEYSEVKETFAQASGILGYDVWAMTQYGPLEELNKTIHTQPVLLTASYAIWKILQEHTTIKPSLLAGHSLGEYTALLCAESLTFDDALKLVVARGQYMQEAVPQGVGAMAAIIGLDEEDVIAICLEASETGKVVSAANFNCPGQTVIAGHREPVERAMLYATEVGAKIATLIQVSVPSHCPLMQPAALRLGALLSNVAIETPKIPIINNVDALPYSHVDSIREGLMRQLYSPVRWTDIIRYFIRDGVKEVIECGPGKVLSGLNKRIDNSLTYISTSDVDNLNQLITRSKYAAT